MELKEIKELIELFATSDIGKLELEQEGLSLRLSKPRERVISAPVGDSAVTGTDFVPAAAEPEEAEVPTNVTIVSSPIVGTFYRAPNPKAEPFVEVGDRVSKGQTLCIVEAMKLMNEIHADCSGVVTEIFVENGEGVEFNQKLLGIKTG
jgi:acetyl-CoA carboxylase biotin carboxyl carrier protein